MNGKQVINTILANECIKAATFARKIGVTPPQIYDLQKEKIKGVSSNIADKILLVYPSYNKSWIMTGMGEMLARCAPDSEGTDILPFEDGKAVESPENAIRNENIQRMSISFEELMDKYEDMTAQRDYWRDKAAELEYKLAKLKVG